MRISVWVFMIILVFDKHFKPRWKLLTMDRYTFFTWIWKVCLFSINVSCFYYFQAVFSFSWVFMKIHESQMTPGKSSRVIHPSVSYVGTHPVLFFFNKRYLEVEIISMKVYFILEKNLHFQSRITFNTF